MINIKKRSLGIELGSTRIKAVLIDETHEVLASGSFEWENEFINGYYTYSLSNIILGLQSCYKNLKDNFKVKYNTVLNEIDAIGISAMMHGYLVLDKNDKPLAMFKTWRNNSAAVAAKELTELFNFNIPARWSIAHLYQAIRDKEPHVNDISYQTTLAGYVHYLLTGNKVVGIGEASGIFPIDVKTRLYNARMVKQFESLTAAANIKLNDILPKVLNAGDFAGSLTASGAKLLDIEGDLAAGIPFCPPEGDAGTGMIATNSIKAQTGNVSVGTSVFGMFVLENEITNVHPEIDIVMTPHGKTVAMVHCNNGTSDLNAWNNIFCEYNDLIGFAGSKSDTIQKLIECSAGGRADAGNMLVYNYVSGEKITDVESCCPTLIRNQESEFTLSNLMRAQIYSVFCTLRIGLDLLKDNEKLELKSVFAHGGLLKTKRVAQSYLSAAINTPVAVMQNAGEGGAFGIAVLAMYSLSGKQALENYLDNIVFKNAKSIIVTADKNTVDGFNSYLNNFKNKLGIIRQLGKVGSKKDDLYSLKEQVYKANLALVRFGLVLHTWGNVSAIDREKNVIVIKPSGVSYDKMTVEDMVVVSLDGKVLEGVLRPSSDLPTHLELYKAFNSINAVTHTHSVYATAWAQSGQNIPFLGTTHADYFYGDVLCTRELTKEEVEEDYEKNTGKVIVETYKNMNPMENPAVLVKSHGVFTFGKTAREAAEYAATVEEVAKMAYLTKTINDKTVSAPDYLLKKHYNRKHGKNAYYGQKGDNNNE